MTDDQFESVSLVCHSHGMFDRSESSGEEGFIEMIYLNRNKENHDTELSKVEKENEIKF